MVKVSLRRSVALVLLLAAADLEAQDGWTSRGPYCAQALGLARGAGRAYLAVGGSLFRSTDGWATWSRIGAELPATYLSAVAVAPESSQIVYFALWDRGGVFRSDDGGETWTAAFPDLPDPLVDALMVPPSPAGTVFAIAPYNGIYRSRDRGETWVDVSPEPGPSNYFALLAHPLHPQRLAAQTFKGLWRSNDGGTTWRAWNTGLPADLDGTKITGLTLSPGDPDIAFVTMYQSLYRSQAGGAWKRIGRIPVNSFGQVNTLVAGPGSPPVLLAGQDGGSTTTPGILRSRDGGRTWLPLPLLGETVYRLSYLPSVGRMVAHSQRSTFYSSDLGSTWKRTGNGVAASQIRSLTSAGAGERILVAGLEGCVGGIARSGDGGNSWQLIDTRVRGVYYGYPSDVQVVASAPSLPSRIYAVSGDQILRSDNGGVSWMHFQFGDAISGGISFAIAVHPTQPNLVFIAGGHGLSRSADGGRTWSGGQHEFPFNDMNTVAFEPGHPERMLAASFYGGLYRSTDTGTTWQPVSGSEFMHFSGLAFDPRNPSVVLARTPFEDARILRSADGGATWALSEFGTEGYLTALTFSADGAAAVAAGDAGAFLSRDGGQTWSRIDGAPSAVRALVLPANGTLQLGTARDGVVSNPGALLP